MARFFVDFDLRMVGAHVALAASLRAARDSYGTDVAHVAGGAIADGAVVVGLADGVALDATTGDGRAAFELGECIGGALHVTGIELFAEGDLFGREAFFSHDGGPGSRGVSAARKFLIDLFVARAAIAGSDLCG